jgi:hypothetical protein
MANTIEETVKDIICDVSIFGVGYSSDYKTIAAIVVNQVRTNYPAFNNNSDSNIRHHLSKILAVNSNHAENKYRGMYHCARDISKACVSPRRYNYTFGVCQVKCVN